MSKIIFLWGPARSLSTAMLKSFQMRNDTTGLFEPYADTYYFSKDRMTDMYGDRPELWEQTGGVVDRQLLSIDTPVLFLKEMAYFGLPYVGEEIFKQSKHTLIIREPKACLRSRKAVRKNEIGEWEFGFTAMDQLWERIFNTDEPPVVIEGDALRNAPEYSLRKYCQAIGLDFQETQLSWNDGNVRKWTDEEAEAHARFHKTLESSTGFIPEIDMHYDDNFQFNDAEWAMVNRATEIYEKIKPFAINL
ncbi:hypothetical protein [Xenorhabdus bovienii]|uniref:sulfotransferase-like domain-containing protein n=1 Tax=Xenorhabdus bovienii TaxID=40576 RepID=UPI00237C8F6D|nr:hypothetical protein [Xenorhabdus bovienii]MDE1474759.1 hypothetical protein [Xenorhabdus bovienii]